MAKTRGYSLNSGEIRQQIRNLCPNADLKKKMQDIKTYLQNQENMLEVEKPKKKVPPTHLIADEFSMAKEKLAEQQDKIKKMLRKKQIKRNMARQEKEKSRMDQIRENNLTRFRTVRVDEISSASDPPTSESSEDFDDTSHSVYDKRKVIDKQQVLVEDIDEDATAQPLDEKGWALLNPKLTELFDEELFQKRLIGMEQKRDFTTVLGDGVGAVVKKFQSGMIDSIAFQQRSKPGPKGMQHDLLDIVQSTAKASFMVRGWDRAAQDNKKLSPCREPSKRKLTKQNSVSKRVFLMTKQRSVRRSPSMFKMTDAIKCEPELREAQELINRSSKQKRKGLRKMQENNQETLANIFQQTEEEIRPLSQNLKQRVKVCH